MTLLIDGDIVAYRSAFSKEVAEETPDGYWTWRCDFNEVKEDVQKTIEYFMNILKAKDYVLCLSSDERNFRKDILPEYKEKRTRIKRPLVLKPIRQWMLDQGAVMYPNLEGDDVIGILATSDEHKDSIIVSMDKDFHTVPSRLYRNGEIVEIEEQEARYWHFYQTLTGDVTDGYKGCPGVGAKKAAEALDKSCTWETVVTLYKKAGLTEEDALTQARCAYILQRKNYDFETGKILHWEPS